MKTDAAELIQELNKLRSDIARDLSDMLRDLEAARVIFGGTMKQHTGIPTVPAPQLYVLEYRDHMGQSRLAVVRTVVRLADKRFTMFTASGEPIHLISDQILTWEPVLRRDPEPLPDGWWRQASEAARTGI